MSHCAVTCSSCFTSGSLQPKPQRFQGGVMLQPSLLAGIVKRSATARLQAHTKFWLQHNSLAVSMSNSNSSEPIHVGGEVSMGSTAPPGGLPISARAFTTTSRTSSPDFGMTSHFTSLFANNQFASGGLALMVVGFAAAGAKSVLELIAEYAKRQLFVRMEIDSRDDAYRWVMSWLARHPQFSNSPRVSVITSLQAFGTSGLEGSLVGNKKMMLLPAPGDHLLTHDGHWVWISRQHKPGNPMASFNARLLPETLVLSAFGGQRSVLESLLSTCAAAYEAETKQRTVVHSMDADGYWVRVGDRPIRPLHTVVLPGNQAESLLADCKEFLASEAWYAHQGIPYRRGYLLYGVPGSGKTSLVTALAGALALDVYVVSLSSPRMTDETLRNLLNTAADRCVLLLEDVDAAFVGRQGQAGASSLTFSGLLNAIDGVAAQEGRLLFMTTNHIEHLSAALIRPGRVDVRCHFGNATSEQAKRLFLTFYEHQAPVAFDAADAAQTDPSQSSQSAPVATLGGAHAMYNQQQLQQWAADFASQVPADLVSMAGLQGYLMKHKHQPQAALAGLKDWVVSLHQAAAQRSKDTESEGAAAS